MMKQISIRLIVFIALMLIAVSGCVSPTEVPPLPTQPPLLTPSVEATIQPTVPSAKLILVDPANQATEEVQAYLASIAAENGLTVETLTALDSSPFGEETKVVLFMAELPGLEEIVAASPSTQFVVIGDPKISPTSNLSIIRAAGEDLAFMAGYLTMQIAWDWRAGALIPTDTVMSAEKANAFENGARYVCGQCTPYYAPLVYFPLLGQESAQAPADAWGAQIDYLAQHFINSYYIDSAISTPDVLDRVSALNTVINNDVRLIGANVASDDRYTALLDFDILPALQQLLPQSLNGTGGQTLGAQVKIRVNNNEKIVSIAKVENFDRVAADLAAGLIVPLSVP